MTDALNIALTPLISKINTAAIIINSLPQLPGYNGSILSIDDEEATRIARELNKVADALAAIIYAQPPQAKMLTDKEIRDAWINRVTFDPSWHDWPEVMAFARAIIAAAQSNKEP